MNQAKIITGLAVATLSTGAGIVHAEDVTPVTPAKEVLITNETVTVPEVTQAQVDSAKAIANQASSDVNAQQNVVNDAQAKTNQAQSNVVSATTAVKDATATVEQSTPEAVTKAQAEVTEATTAVKNAETNLTTAETTATEANTAVTNQTQVVNENKSSVDQAQTDATKAQQVVDTAKQAIDSTTANTSLSEAEKTVAEKTTNVATAETNLSEAQKADANLANQTASAQEAVVQKELAVKDTQTLLNQVATELNNEKVSTSLENQTYYNQRDGAWSGYFGQYGFDATGCVPTSLAMVFTELARRQITPTEIANYLWNNTNEFNKNYGGTSGRGIVDATNHYGFVPTHLSSQSAIIEALQAGHYVVSAVQQNKFSPWGIQYSHEIVLRGYSNGNTYVYDPYNRANIGWYPVSNLWNEQSRDSIDTASVGVPFFKITTQKMAQLEAQKAQAQSAVNTAQSQLTQAKQILSSLQTTALKTPEAQRKLDTAKVELATAQDSYVKAQEAVHLASQDLAVKEATLKDAQADLLTKQTALASAQKTLSESQVKLATLQSNLANVQAKVKEAQLALSNANTAVGQKETQLLNLQNAPKVLADAQTRLSQAKAELAKKVSILNQEIVKLKELQSKQADAEAQYTTVFEAYKAVLDAKKQASLAESYAYIIAGGGQATPVVDETGKITGYVDGSKKVVSNDMNVSSTSSQKEVVKNEMNKLTTLASVPHSLPQTGDKGMSSLTLLGFVGMSLFRLISYKKREN